MENTPPLTLILGICGILFLAVGLPLSLYYGMRRKNGPSTGEVLNRAGQGARQPWSREDKALNQLSAEADRIRARQAGRAEGPEDEKPANSP